MKLEDLRKFQRHELTMEFANGRSLTAPLSHWLGALLRTLDQPTMNKVVDSVLQFRTQPPIQRAKLHLPPQLKAEENIANGV